ncbi:hypothetical protein EVJ58_g3217 [Rhodofomes roseus]|uniref:Ribosomal RNA methyltransferase FtsJ domain-containing protein n=1 Tax=Rhodofomes roseus TaxID=34475 RepID=A0A4Y9YM55_9APHY|nr:hypothetical protein EVJ58_g3217 [Rhodofomes roseus]
MDHTTVARFTTIADVDRQISLVLSDSPILTNFITSRLTRFEHPFFNASPADALPRLLVLKELYRVHDAVDRTYAEHARANRARPASASDLEVFRRTFEEIVELTTHRRPEFRSALGRARRFLDLGCAPGGFATWLLQNTGMQGMGITLPSDTSVPGVPVQDALQSYTPRFPVYLEDVCEIARGQSVTDWEKHVPSTGFDLIIANACIMLAESSVPRSTKIRLMYAQLLIALERITAGGTLILSLWMRPFDWVVDIVAILNGSFGSIDAIKPRYQGKTSFAYIVCQDYKITANKPRHIEHLRAVIQHLDSAEAGDIDTPTLPNLFDSGTPDEETVAFIWHKFRPGRTFQPVPELPNRISQTPGNPWAIECRPFVRLAQTRSRAAQ